MTGSPPILMYHKLSSAEQGNNYTLDSSLFSDHLSTLSVRQFAAFRIEDYDRSTLNAVHTIPDRSILITFDDGHESDYTIALPLLKKHGYTATFFITTDWIGKPGYMNPAQLRCLQKEGMSIQSHAKTHVFLDRLDERRVNEELRDSKNRLQDILGADVSFLSFPGGRYNKRVLDCVSKNNYTAVLSSDPSPLKKYENIFMLGRYIMKRELSMRSFLNMIEGNQLFRFKSVFYHHGKSFLKSILNEELYYRLWKYKNKS